MDGNAVHGQPFRLVGQRIMRRWCYQGHGQKATCFHLDAGECFPASAEDSSDMLSEEDLRKHEKLVREADMKEIKSFVDDKVFKVALRSQAKSTMSCLWLRKWKGKEVKSRLVVRGSLDLSLIHI